VHIAHRTPTIPMKKLAPAQYGIITDENHPLDGALVMRTSQGEEIIVMLIAPGAGIGQHWIETETPLDLETQVRPVSKITIIIED